MHGTWKKTPVSRLLDLGHRTAAFELCRRLTPKRITVLAYHRIADTNDDAFCTFAPNVSATPEVFATQMDYLQKYYNPISLDQLLAWLKDEAPLPTHSALVTFDDGYRDNFTHAMPILRERHIPAVLFLATDCVSSMTPFYWDLVAFMFAKSPRNQADLPMLGIHSLNDRGMRRKLGDRWVAQAKKLQPADRAVAVDALSKALQVPPNDAAFGDLYVTWEEVRIMAANGIAMGAHTCSHPILSQVSQEEARRQICRSKAAIEDALGTKVTSFAYPNGLSDDYHDLHMTILENAGFEAAFTLAPGPCWPRETRSRPFDIRRTLVSMKDDIPRFSAKLIGLSRLWNSI